MPSKGASSVVLFDQFNMSGYLNDVKTMQNVDSVDVSVLGATSKAFQTTLVSGKASFAGFFDATAVIGSDTVFPPTLGNVTANVLSWGVGNDFTLGNRVKLAKTRTMDYEVGAAVADVVKITANLQSDGPIDSGISLHTLVAVTTTENGSSVDNAAASSNGGVAHLHVLAVSGSPGATIKVQDSTNNSVWTDLVTFSNVTAVGTERVELAAGSTVKRYVRYILSALTLDSITFVVTFARR